MKTAMKKLFSLVLVAVLLVGVFPMAAFAAEGDYFFWFEVHVNDANYTGKYIEVAPGTAFTDEQLLNEAKKLYPDAFPESYDWTIGGNKAADANNNGADIYVTPKVVDPCADGHDWNAGEITTQPTCTEAGVKTFTCTNNPKHTTTEPVAALNHNVVNGKCTRCVYEEPQAPAPATVAIRARASVNEPYANGGSFEVPAGTYSAAEIFNKANYTGTIEGYSVSNESTSIVCDGNKEITLTAGDLYYLWIELPEDPAVTPNPQPTPDPIPEMCEFCYADKGECVLCETCKKCVKEGNHNACSTENHKGQVKVYMNLNYIGAYDFGEHVDYVWADRNDLLRNVVAGIPAPNRDKHKFQYWTTDQAGTDIIDRQNNARATADGVVIYAQWADDVQATNGKITLHIALNYDYKMGEPIRNIAWGTRMGSILENVNEPTRWNHKFVGWYWDADCTDAVEYNDRVYKDDVIFAKWEKRDTNHEVMLKIYVNGNTTSVAKIVDMYEYSKDGKISMSEVKEVVKKYYTSKNSDGMSYRGLFETYGWSAYVRNHMHNGSDEINVLKFDDTTVYVMVHNAKVRTSSSGTADSSNPKTGDMIMAPAMVLGASVSALAVLFYLNKKRAV